jgi:MoxR-like ATPase
MIAVEQIQARVEGHRLVAQLVMDEVGKVIVGQREMIEGLLWGLLADGHVLLEGVPGLAKTTAVKALSRTLDADFQRIQFTPDLLPADVVGTQIYNPKDATFTTRRGPVFANILLADEINRAPAKVQSALLEAMEERQVTIGGETFPLPDPFLVLATQNPIEQEGTYPLPEAQVDRFLVKLRVRYPTRDEERAMLDRPQGALETVQPVLTLEVLRAMRETAAAVHLEPIVSDYIVDLVQATRDPTAIALAELSALIDYGASPRATLALSKLARVHAFLQGRGWAGPDDVKAVAPAVLRHRLVLSYEAEATEVTPDEVVRRILDAVPTP